MESPRGMMRTVPGILVTPASLGGVPPELPPELDPPLLDEAPLEELLADDPPLEDPARPASRAPESPPASAVPDPDPLPPPEPEAELDVDPLEDVDPAGEE